MLVTKIITVNIGNNIAHFESKGYIIPKIKGHVRRGTTIEVDVSDLPNSSTVKIEYQCEKCLLIFETKYYHYYKNKNSLCRKCSTAKTASNRTVIDKRSGEKHPRYNKNLDAETRIRNRDLPEYRKWRKAVYEKCDYTCQCCGDKKGGNLVAHHLNGWHWSISERFLVSNGITLCEECHEKFHGKYGYENNTREQCFDFLIEELQKTNRSEASKLFADM